MTATVKIARYKPFEIIVLWKGLVILQPGLQFKTMDPTGKIWTGQCDLQDSDDVKHSQVPGKLDKIDSIWSIL